MSQSAAPPPSALPEFRVAQRWNIVWVVPVIAVLIGIWLAIHHITSKGPVARVRFDTAEGIMAGKTEVRCRSVRVGFVNRVELSKDLNFVWITLQLDPSAKPLLREHTNFWVVRPRISATDVSGLGTLITGAYIELDPGNGKDDVIEFVGRETPPATSRSIPGRRLKLTADRAGSLTAGSPIHYRGYEVGRVESRTLDIEGRQVTYDVFIREEYSSLINTNTRFWNSSGIDVAAGASGFRVRTPSLQALISGGATFGVPDGGAAGEPVGDDATFTLFPDEEAAKDSTFLPTMKFLLLFDQSIRGLRRGAPVEFRGLPLGRVADISFDYQTVPGDRRIPVLIEIDPALLRRETAEKMADPHGDFMRAAIGRGFRAALKTGSLLTGALYVDLDYYPDAPAADLTMTGEYQTIPTVSSGLAQLEAKLSAILDKLQALPLEEAVGKIATAADESAQTIAEARATLKEIEAATAAARETLEDPAFRELPGDLRSTLDELQKSVSSVGPDGAVQGDLLRTLDELRAALRSFKALTTTVDEKPNSLIFGRDSSGNPTPRAPNR